MSRRPDVLRVTPEARRADELALVKARLDALERRTVQAIQKFSVYDPAEVSTASSSWASLSSTAIPIVVEENSLVLMYWEYELRTSGVASGAYGGVAFSGGVYSESIQRSTVTSYRVMRPYLAPDDYMTVGAVSTPLGRIYTAPGEYNVQLAHKADGGLTMYARNRRLWVAVL